MLTACHTKIKEPVLGPGYKLNNVFAVSGTLPPELRRVAVLPIHIRTINFNNEDGKDNLTPILLKELQKSGRFEIIPISPDEMIELSGRASWPISDKFPLSFFTKIKEKTGADCVLLTTLTQYSPYPPLQLGWETRLADEKRIIWSVDELFDAGNQEVANEAQRYYQHYFNKKEYLADAETVLRTPVQFGQYTLDAIFRTIPPR